MALFLGNHLQLSRQNPETLISMVKRSRGELNYRAGTIPSGLDCQQQARRAPVGWVFLDRAVSRCFLSLCHVQSLRAAGYWLGVCGVAEPQAHKGENPNLVRLQGVACRKAKLLSASSSLHRSLWRCFCSPSVSAGPPTWVLYMSTSVPSAISEVQIQTPAIAFTRTDTAGTTGGGGSYPGACHNLEQGF